MPRYIDADALIADLEKAMLLARTNEEIADLKLCKEIVRTAPTISTDEVRGVVHCKDCKWCHAGYCEKYDDLIPWGCANKPWEEWFCADGENMEVTSDAE